MTPVPNSDQCKSCEGKGYHRIRWVPYEPRNYNSCWRCNGTGRVAPDGGKR